jgi:hypothetical protein
MFKTNTSLIQYIDINVSYIDVNVSGMDINVCYVGTESQVNCYP